MNYLLDTNALLWSAGDVARLSPHARSIIETVTNRIWFSQVSVWEIQIKLGTGKLRLQRPLPDIVTGLLTVGEFKLLPLSGSHLCLEYSSGPSQRPL